MNYIWLLYSLDTCKKCLLLQFEFLSSTSDTETVHSFIQLQFNFWLFKTRQESAIIGHWGLQGRMAKLSNSIKMKVRPSYLIFSFFRENFCKFTQIDPVKLPGSMCIFSYSAYCISANITWAVEF